MKVFDFIRQKFLSISHYDHFDWQAVYMSIGITVLCLLIDMICVGWSQSSLHKLTKQFGLIKNDFFSFLLQLSGLTQLLGVLFYGGIFYFIYGQVQKHVGFHLIAVIDSVALQIVIMLLVSDFKDYVLHWLLHKLGWGWELHKFHHSAVEMTILTSHRSHAAENVLADFLSLVVFITLGLPAGTYLAVTLLHQAHQRLVHSQINSDWGWIGTYILVSPAAHRLHHSKDPAHYGKNFGNRFIFWDRMFGTYFRPDKNIQYEFGLVDNEFNQHGYVHDLLHSYLRSLRVAKASTVSLFRRRKGMTPVYQQEMVVIEDPQPQNAEVG